MVFLSVSEGNGYWAYEHLVSEPQTSFVHLISISRLLLSPVTKINQGEIAVTTSRVPAIASQFSV